MSNETIIDEATRNCATPQVKMTNEINDFKEFEKIGCNKFITHHKSYERLMSFFYHFIYVVPLCFHIYSLFDIQLSQFLIAFMGALVTDGFFFLHGHLYLHETMLIGFQHKTVKAGFAYYHHYVTPSLYPQLPFGYRMTFSIFLLPFDIFCYLFNVNKYVYALLNVVMLIEVISHEYMHSTRKYHYVSFNPLSSKFILIHYIMKGLQTLTFIDTSTHLKEHHREKSENMHLTMDWLDLKVPIVSHLQELYGNMEFKNFRKILKMFNGTDKAIFVDNKMNFKAKVEVFIASIWFTMKLSFLIYLLSFIQFYNINPIDTNLFIYTTVLRIVHPFINFTFVRGRTSQILESI